MAFLSASQDIVIDAYRRELLPDNEQGLGSAVHVNAYRVAGMVPGALSLILADLMPWQAVFWITAAVHAAGLGLHAADQGAGGVWIAAEKPARGSGIAVPRIHRAWRLGQRAAGSSASSSCTSWAIRMATALATKFYLDLGFTMTQIGVIAKTTGFWASLVGGLLGGVWMIRIGINRGLWMFGVVQAVAILGFAWLAQVGADPLVLALVIGFEAFGVGVGTAAFVAYIATHHRSALHRHPVRAVHQPGGGAAHLHQFLGRLHRRPDRLVQFLPDLLRAGAAGHAAAAESGAVECAEAAAGWRRSSSLAGVSWKIA